MSYFGITINTMTLGGLAIAIGELVDDAIVDVENVFRRLKQNAQSPAPEPVVEVIFKASSEIRNSIVFATLIIVLVFLPLFALGGFEGRMFAPLAFAYIISITASLVVALTVTPVLCYFLLGRSKLIHDEKDSRLVAWLKRHYARALDWTLRHPYKIVGASAVDARCRGAALPAHGARIPAAVQRRHAQHQREPAARHVARRSRTASADRSRRRCTKSPKSSRPRAARAAPNSTSMPPASTRARSRWSRRRATGRTPESWRRCGRSSRTIPGVTVEVGQPISHRIDHLLSGTRAQIAIKLFGPDLATLRTKAGEIRDAMATVPGVVDLLVEPQVGVPQVQININRRAAAAVGLSAEDLAEAVDVAFNGEVVSQVLEEQRTYDVLVRFDDRRGSRSRRSAGH